MADDATEQAFLERLTRIARGEKGDPYSPFEPLPTAEQKAEAMRQYLEIKAAQAARVVRGEDHALERERFALQSQVELERLRLEVMRANVEAEATRGKLLVEVERIKIQQAELVVRAMEAAATSPEAARVLESVTQRLLNDAPSTKLLPSE